ncbi:TorD/DmsD family molecular chaperone [Atlantibacter hermannii]|uniref:TorD/DmsD family molecular chaperone n=1 Tax=Atlantibacter hermannii TaxID=565 RepID=UPI0013EF3BC1|nr:molecular chaperone [Atlantibacter hermannii]
MSSAAVVPRILGALFYYSPDRADVKALVDCLPTLPSLYAWRDPQRVSALCDNWPVPAQEEWVWQFSALFEGQGDMVAPPWGSVYLEKDNLLMGDTTADYRLFLRQHDMAFAGQQNEPEDQFGLMLLAFSALIERDNAIAAATLLEQHLLPWAPRYLDLLKNNTLSPFYARLAQLAALFLTDIEHQYGLQPTTRRTFF